MVVLNVIKLNKYSTPNYIIIIIDNYIKYYLKYFVHLFMNILINILLLFFQLQ